VQNSGDKSGQLLGDPSRPNGLGTASFRAGQDPAGHACRLHTACIISKSYTWVWVSKSPRASVRFSAAQRSQCSVPQHPLALVLALPVPGSYRPASSELDRALQVAQSVRPSLASVRNNMPVSCRVLVLFSCSYFVRKQAVHVSQWHARASSYRRRPAALPNVTETRPRGHVGRCEPSPRLEFHSTLDLHPKRHAKKPRVRLGCSSLPLPLPGRSIPRQCGTRMDLRRSLTRGSRWFAR
jgi:hypothetical protein